MSNSRKGNNFSAEVHRILAGRAGYRCSICGALTVGPKEGSQGVHNMGIAAHITAAAEGGPRHDKELLISERKSYENGIWCCIRHGKIVDDDEEQWTVDELRRYKQQIEQLAGRNIGIVSMQDFPPRLEVRSEAVADMYQIRPHFYQIKLQLVLKNVGGATAKNFSIRVQPGRYLKWHPYTREGQHEIDTRRIEKAEHSPDGFDTFQNDVLILHANRRHCMLLFVAHLRLDEVNEEDQLRYSVACSDAAPIEGVIGINFSEILEKSRVTKPNVLRAWLKTQGHD